jgi:gas vesicle protein GvpL/GvpF
MPLLAYCLAEARDEISFPHAGVQGMPLRNVRSGNLECLVSDFETSDVVGRASIKDAALEFNRTLQDVLRQYTIVPFRFPTVLADENELLELLTEHAPEYEEALARLRGTVQIDIRVDAQDSGTLAKSSGTEYLRGREARYHTLQQIAAQFRHAGKEWVRQWRDRDTALGLRCSVLLGREHVDEFIAAARQLSIPRGYTARVSGPWPPAEFVKKK